ncbi:MAG: hypothetical protein QG657_4300 [Acidobacteriota bacterium]|nr:hypothetical protein [Acidobacteriota bacterium]
MKIFKATYIMESQRLLNNKNITLLILFSLLSLYFVQIGIDNYKSIIENKEKFLDIERLKVYQYINYAQYGAYGFRILFIPSPVSVYFVNSSVISELTANVDSGERLNIYNSFKDRTLFADKAGGFKDFSGIMLLLGSLLVLYSGYESIIHKDYLRFMAGFTGHRKLFLSIFFSRVLVFTLLFLFIGGISLLLLKINGIQLSENEWSHWFIYLGVLALLSVFFFVLGTIAGTFKSRFAGFVVLIFLWFVFVFLAPGVVNAIISHNADNIVSNYQLELEKLKILMDFEKQAAEKAGPVEESNTETERELVESAWNNEFKKLQALEKKLQNEMEANIRRYQTLSCFFPSTFYLSAGNEIGGKGYENFIRFYEYIQVLKWKFIIFYIDKRYYSDFSKVEPFIKDSGNLFYARAHLPRNFTAGIWLTVVYILALFAVSYVRFKKSVRL